MEFENPLILTTPHIRGYRVRDAQYLLAGHNSFAPYVHSIRTYKGAIDGEYGPESALASKMAKYWLGYPEAEVDRRFGQGIYNYLRTDSGHKRLPSDFLKRREDRITLAAQSPKLKAVKFALAEVGNRESPYGSNCQKYGQWYEFNCVPWCAIFATYCFYHTGKTNWHYSYVPSIVDDARAGRNGMTLTRSPEPGDLVAYTFRGIPNAHVAFFLSWINSYNFYDVGGNTGPINMSNGGEVLQQERNVGQVTHFIRIL
jgi:hypothetical protein